MDYFEIPVIWEKRGVIRINKTKCQSISDAINFIEKNKNGIPIPDGEFVKGSLKVVKEDK